MIDGKVAPWQVSLGLEAFGFEAFAVEVVGWPAIIVEGMVC